MIKSKLKQTALLVLTLLATTMATAQTVNMSKYITLTVTRGQSIGLNFKTAAAGTKVKVKSGARETEVTVGTSWTGLQNYTSGSTTMTVYGDIVGFDCSSNGAKLTALDVSKNIELKELFCGGNHFTTLAFDDLMCLLPTRVASDSAKFYPLNNAADAAASGFMRANSQIAKNKNWQVRYAAGGDIPATRGTYVCPTLNMSCYITLTVRQGEMIQLIFRAAKPRTPVKIISGSTDTVFTVGTSWSGIKKYAAGATTMTIYGDITGFDCRENEAKLTALDVSQNTELRELFCHNNNFTTQTFDDLMCSLPTRATADNAKFFPIYEPAVTVSAAFMAANSQIAKNKNWKVRYFEGTQNEIPATTGTYTCPVITAIAEVASVPPAVYPNPATDILTVETEAIGAAITLTDLTGRTVLTATATASKTTLNIAHLSAGTYIVRVGDRVGKVIKR